MNLHLWICKRHLRVNLCEICACTNIASHMSVTECTRDTSGVLLRPKERIPSPIITVQCLKKTQKKGQPADNTTVN